LPYDPLLYYLLEKRSPTKQLIFFDHIKITEEQEKGILSELEKNKINWIVLSNRINSAETGLGVLGQTYCPLIGKYIEDNFEVVAKFGDWINPPGWAWNYGIKILHRKKSDK